MNARAPGIVIAGGGTGGHLFPGLAIADALKRREPDARITFVGTKHKIEGRVVPQRGYAFVPIWISGFRRTLTAENLLFPLKLLVALVQSFFLMKKLRPDVVVGTGGYVCGPPLYVASLLGVPTVVQEQNSMPGATTKFLAPRATQVHLSFESTRRALRRQDNIRVSGNPTFGSGTRITAADGLKYFRLSESTSTLLVFGGSLGASSINRALFANLQEIRSLNVQIIWQTGERDFEAVKREVERLEADNRPPVVRVFPFIDRMQYAYAASRLAVCRAGATTIAELTGLGVPAILVPYPHAAADHQKQNAALLVREGAAVMIEDHELHERIVPAVREVIGNSERLRMMSLKAQALGKPQAAETIADAVLALVRR